jgi:predicted dehydrogenase
MSTPIRCGILGTGHPHAGGKVKTLLDSDEWEVVGIHEPDESWKARTADRSPFNEVQFVDADILLADESIQMLAIESEIQQLLPLGRLAIEAGKHIHLDKPAGVELSEFKDLINLANENNLIIQMGYMFRYNEGFDLVRRAVRDGWLGEVHYIHCAMLSDIRAESRKTMAFHPGGFMFEIGGHLFDMVHLLLGVPEKVTPFIRNDGPFDDEFNDNVLAVLEYPNAMALVETSAIDASGMKRRMFEVVGDKGTAIVQPHEPPAIKLHLKEAAGGYDAGWHDIEVPFTGRYILDIVELARCIQGCQKFPYSTDHDYAVQETLLKASGVL